MDTFLSIFGSILGIYLLTVLICGSVNRFLFHRVDRLPIFIMFLPFVNIVATVIVSIALLIDFVEEKTENPVAVFKKWYYEK